MKTISDLTRDHRAAAPVNELLAPAAFLTETAVLTKQQDIFSVVRIGGVDPECLDPEEIDHAAMRFESALRTLGPEFRVYQYALKREMAAGALTEDKHPIAKRRTEYFLERAEPFYSIELYLVILRLHQAQDTRGTIQKFLSGFSVKSSVLRVAQWELLAELLALETAIHSVVAQLADVARPVLLEKRATLEFLKRLVNYTSWKSIVYGEPSADAVDQQMAEAGFETWKNHIEQDGLHIKVLSLREPPATTFAYMLKGLIAIPCGFVICSEWWLESPFKIRKEIDKRRRHYHADKVSGRSYMWNQNPQAHEILIDDSKSAVVNELNELLREIEVNEKRLGRFSFTMALYGSDRAKVNRAVANVNEIFGIHGARLYEEGYNLLNAWLAMVPGNYAMNLRPIYLLNPSYAHLSVSLFAPHTGNPRNEFLDEPRLAVVDTRQGVPFAFNLHYQDVGHTLLMGSIGSGKSVTTNFLVASLQEYLPYTVIFDVGGSYRKLTAEYSGSYLHVGKDMRGFSINPFSLPSTPENLNFLFTFVWLLIDMSSGQKLTAEEEVDLNRVIRDLYMLHPADRRLRTVAITAKPSYARRLAPWVEDGMHARFFDNAEDTLSIARFQTFDFEGLADQADVLEPLLFYVLHRANATIYDQAQASTLKAFVLDEAWRFFRNDITRAYITEALKTWRKRNALMILATQSSADLEREKLLAVVAESCMTKLFLSNPGMDEEAYARLFHLNKTQTGLIARLTPKREMLLVRPDGAKVLALQLDPDALATFSINAQPQYAAAPHSNL